MIKDDAIYEIAAQQPVNTQALAALRTIPRGFERSRTAEDILGAVKRALAIPRDELPQVPKGRMAPDGSAAAVDLLKVLPTVVWLGVMELLDMCPMELLDMEIF